MNELKSTKDMAGNTIKVGDNVTFNSRGGFRLGQVVEIDDSRDVRVQVDGGWKRTMMPTNVLLEVLS